LGYNLGFEAKQNQVNKARKRLCRAIYGRCRIALFNAPPPIPATAEGEAYRHLLEKRLDDLEREKLQIMETSSQRSRSLPGISSHYRHWTGWLKYQLDRLRW